MVISDLITPLMTKKQLEQYEQYLHAGKSHLTPRAVAGANPVPSAAGRPAGTVLKDKDSLVQETVYRLSSQIARICNRYNLSENISMATEVDLAETANYTTVTLTATIDWFPNPYVFIAQEKIKTSNKTKYSGVLKRKGLGQQQRPATSSDEIPF